MPRIKDDLQNATTKRDERTIIGAVIGFILGAFLGWDGLAGVIGAAVIGFFVYTAYDKEVQSYKKIEEMKK